MFEIYRYIYIYDRTGQVPNHTRESISVMGGFYITAHALLLWKVKEGKRESSLGDTEEHRKKYVSVVKKSLQSENKLSVQKYVWEV